MSVSAGKKRASPGDDGPKIAENALSDQDVLKIESAQQAVDHAELALQQKAYRAMEPVYQKRRAILKTIDKFWPTALVNSGIAIHIQHKEDQLAISYLEDVWLVRDKVEPRAFSLEFYFKENPFFTDSVLTKEFKYIPPPASSEATEKPEHEGLTQAMIDFSWERDVDPQSIKISWKSDTKKLTKLFPRVPDVDEDDDVPADPGSFFNLFELKDDPFDIGLTLATEVFPQAIDHFFGRVDNASDVADETDSEEEDEEEDEAEIDLEKPRKKKPKHQ